MTYNAVPVDGSRTAHGRVGQLIVDLNLKWCGKLDKEWSNITYIQAVAFGGKDGGAMELTRIR